MLIISNNFSSYECCAFVKSKQPCKALFFTSRAEPQKPANFSTSSPVITESSPLGKLNINVTALQKNVGSAKRQIKALTNHSADDIRTNPALRLKVAQLELTLNHIFEESTGALVQGDLAAAITTLAELKKPL